MKTLHTPSPWFVANSGGCVLHHNGIRYDKIAILETSPLLITEEVEANAQLIAIAPDLLEMLHGTMKALNRMIEKHDPDSIEAEWVGNAHEVIHKATKGYYNNANS